MTRPTLRHPSKRLGGRPAFQVRGTILAETLKLILLGTACGVSVWGLNRHQQEQLRTSADQAPLSFVLPGVPSGMDELVLADLAEFRDIPWASEGLCGLVWAQLDRSPWVQTVERVSTAEPGVIVATCTYRQPIALVQQQEYFFMVDEYGIRLPGQYGYQPGWPLIQGVEQGLPQAGEVWPGEDIAAGLRLVNLLLSKPYREQVVAVLLHNYGGRRDPARCHVELVTDRNASRILWGSAPGEELEENTAAQKLSILFGNYREHGRIDAYHPTIDISVFPDRFIIPA